MIKIDLKRIYDKYSNKDGARILVDRIWPRGIKKSEAKIDHWAKELAPSTELRKWFNHDPCKWDEFKAKYFTELGENIESVIKILKLSKNNKITFIYSAKNIKYNQAVALKEFVEKLLPHL